MKNFNFKKYAIAVIVVFIVYRLLDFLVHGLILGSTYESLSDTGLWREDMQSLMWIMYITGFIFSMFFVYLYHFFTTAYKKGGWMAGLYFGLVVGFLIMVTGMFNQYAVYNVTLSLTWQWVIYGVIEMAILGIVTALLYTPKVPVAA